MSDVALWSGELPGLELPHNCELVLSSDTPPRALTSSAFVFGLDRSSRLLLTYIDAPDRGGWDVTGGHVAPSEELPTTAVRELREETGWSLQESELSIAGWNRISILGRRPAGFRYPFPVGHMAYFLARLTGDERMTKPEFDSECSKASWVEPDIVKDWCTNRRWLPLFEALTLG